MVSNTPGSAEAFNNDIPERTANFSDISDRKEILLQKFLHHIDNTLDIILKAYPLPLFILATEKYWAILKTYQT
ncbi:MAG: hypothetical protein IPL50_16265 [Chitinophagaceae bacterium]|nr:hypothetical protein [Chitinophagaceae bacterium]